MSDEEREEKELDLSSAEVVTKYKTAAEIVNSVFLTLSMSFSSSFCVFVFFFLHWTHFFAETQSKFAAFYLYVYAYVRFHELYCFFVYDFSEALKLVISECKPKAKIVDLCEKGDSYIRE